MKEYEIEVEVTQKFIYSGTVEADSPEEAIKLYKENPDNYQLDEDVMLESFDDPNTITCIGERIGDNGFSLFKRFDNPIKLTE